MVNTFVATAISFVRQALDGPQDVSFLPEYYAILNLAKVYILIGSKHADLDRQRYHGATYPQDKDSHSLLTEEIKLKTRGTLPLFYETLCGRQVRKERSIQLRDVFPYVSGITAEYGIATGKNPRLAALHVQHNEIARKPGWFAVGVAIGLNDRHQKVSVRQLPILSGFSKVKGELNSFQSTAFDSNITSFADVLDQAIDSRLIYHTDKGPSLTAVPQGTFRTLDIPEEFPIVLMFFHMSSVVRCKPEFLNRLRSSKYWPMLATARRHCLLKFLQLFWSFTHNEMIVLRST